jgi:hypothetical protein
MPEKTLNSFEVIGDAIGGRCGEEGLVDHFSTLLRLSWNVPRTKIKAPLGIVTPEPRRNWGRRVM